MKITNRHGIAALRWILDHQNEFGLIRREVAVLAGASSEGEVETWLSEEEQIPARAIKQLGLFLGIYKGLVAITPAGHEKLAFEWFQHNTTIFPDFPGLSIRDYLLQNPTGDAFDTAFRSVRAFAN